LKTKYCCCCFLCWQKEKKSVQGWPEKN